MPVPTIYPYIVTPDYPPAAEDRPDRWRPLGHGLSVTLVTEEEGMVRNLTDEEAASLPGTFDEINAVALSNLQQFLRDGSVKSKVFPRGPLGHPFALFGGHWAAAACLLLPGLHAKLGPALHAADLCASIPNRDTLLVFGQGDLDYRDAMRAMILENEAGEPKPLTWELFHLGPAGVAPFTEPT